MATDARERRLAWLQHAHAMEQQAETPGIVAKR